MPKNLNSFIQKSGESGLIVGLISKSINMTFSGYANQKEASEKKVIRNLFKTNQDAFNTGKK
jgi:hypothetical protein